MQCFCQDKKSGALTRGCTNHSSPLEAGKSCKGQKGKLLGGMERRRGLDCMMLVPSYRQLKHDLLCLLLQLRTGIFEFWEGLEILQINVT